MTCSDFYFEKKIPAVLKQTDREDVVSKTYGSFQVESRRRLLSLSSGLRPLKDSASVVCEGESFRELVNLVSCC